MPGKSSGMKTLSDGRSRRLLSMVVCLLIWPLFLTFSPGTLFPTPQIFMPCKHFSLTLTSSQLVALLITNLLSLLQVGFSRGPSRSKSQDAKESKKGSGRGWKTTRLRCSPDSKWGTERAGHWPEVTQLMRGCAGVLILEPILDLGDLESSMICHLQWDGASEPRAHFLRWVEKVRGTGYLLPIGGSPPLALPGPGKHGMSPLHSQLFLRTPCRVGNTGTYASPRVPVYSADTWPHSPQARLWRSSSVSISIPKQDPALPKVQTNMDLKKYYFNPLPPK